MSSSGYSFELISAIIDASPIGMLLVDGRGKIVFSNTKSENIFGYGEHELIGLSVNCLVPDKLREIHESIRDEFVNSSSSHAMDYGRVLPGRKKNGFEVQLQIGLTPLQFENKNYILASIIDIYNQVLKVASYHDALTGLANRNLFRELANNLHSLSIRNRLGLSMLFLDLDGFKNVNDKFGHATGDGVLCKVADVLSASVRKNDIVSRIGGDEFIMCLYGIESMQQLEIVAKTIIEKVSLIKKINDQAVSIGISIGALYIARPEEWLLDDMIKEADKLMYRAKAMGKGGVVAENKA